MKRLLIIFFLLVGWNVQAKEKVDMIINVSGGNCKHIHIKDKSGNVLLTTHEEEIKKPKDYGVDSQILYQLKETIEKMSDVDKQDITKIKDKIELEDYDVKKDN